MTASSPRRLATTLACVAAAVTFALAGCSTGLISQTARDVAAVPGANAQAGVIALRDLRVDYNGTDGYAQGADAPLVVRLFNTSTDTTVTLTGVSTPAASGVSLVGGPTTVVTSQAAPATSAPASPSATASASATAGASGSPAPSDSASASPSAVATTSAAPPPPATTSSVSIPIPPQATALLVPGQGSYLQLTGLTAPIVPGQTVPVTFTFDDGSTTTVALPLVPDPQETIERGAPVVTSAAE